MESENVTKLLPNQEGRVPGFFVAYRKKAKGRPTERIWRYYPAQSEASMTSKTQIAEKIRYPLGFSSEKSIDDATIDELCIVRKRIENELHQAEIKKRTPHVTGPLRKALELTLRIGRADLFEFLEESADKPAVMRNLRKISFKDDNKAISILESLSKKFGSSIKSVSRNEVASNAPSENQVAEREMPPIPEGMDSNLELVCWMKVLE